MQVVTNTTCCQRDSQELRAYTIPLQSYEQGDMEAVARHVLYQVANAPPVLIPRTPVRYPRQQTCIMVPHRCLLLPPCATGACTIRAHSTCYSPTPTPSHIDEVLHCEKAKNISPTVEALTVSRHVMAELALVGAGALPVPDVMRLANTRRII